jgi:hypothetical protein
MHETEEELRVVKGICHCAESGKKRYHGIGGKLLIVSNGRTGALMEELCMLLSQAIADDTMRFTKGVPAYKVFGIWTCERVKHPQILEMSFTNNSNSASILLFCQGHSLFLFNEIYNSLFIFVLNM